MFLDFQEAANVGFDVDGMRCIWQLTGIRDVGRSILQQWMYISKSAKLKANEATQLDVVARAI